MSLPPTVREVMLRVRHEYDLSTFIEGGTYHGQTAYWASTHFANVITVEMSHALYDKARSEYSHVDNISFVQGDTRNIFKTLSEGQVHGAAFWLDSHWSGAGTYGDNDECPLLDELDIILSHPRCPFLFIDDARLFLAPPPLPHRSEQWPDIIRIIERVQSTGHSFFLFIYDDVIMIGPEHAQPFITSVLQRITAQQPACGTPSKPYASVRRRLHAAFRGLKRLAR